MIRVYHVGPCAAPRQSQRDAWNPKPAVARYHAYRDEVRLRSIQLPPNGYHVVFVFPMPASWSKAKRAAMNGMPHQRTPDRDNCEKALLDAVFNQTDCAGDGHVWDGRVTKLWGEQPLTIISTREPIDLSLPVNLEPYYALHHGTLIDGK